MPQHLRLDIQAKAADKDYQVVKFIGEFDKAGHSEIKSDLDAVVSGFEGDKLFFDFHGLKFINSEGIGYLMEIHTGLANKKKKLVIVGLNAHVADVFNAIGIKDVVDIASSVESYLNKS